MILFIPKSLHSTQKYVCSYSIELTLTDLRYKPIFTLKFDYVRFTAQDIGVKG